MVSVTNIIVMRFDTLRTFAPSLRVISHASLGHNAMLANLPFIEINSRKIYYRFQSFDGNIVQLLRDNVRAKLKRFGDEPHHYPADYSSSSLVKISTG